MKNFIENRVFFKNCFSHGAGYSIISAFILVFQLIFHQAIAQQVVQLKLFTEDLKPYGNISLSINQGQFVPIPSAGVAFVNLTKTQFPIKTITTSDETLEAASWNFSKGILEVSLRKKSYVNVEVSVRDSLARPIVGVTVSFYGEKTVILTSNAKGIISLPLGLNEKVSNKNQFRIKGYKLIRYSNEEQPNQLIVKQEYDKKTVSEAKTNNSPVVDRNWNVYVPERLIATETIQDFYAFINTIPKDKITADTQELIDLKFEEIVSELGGGYSIDSMSYIQNSTDSTTYKVDINNILKQLNPEGERLPEERIAFEKKIQLVSDKLNMGFVNLPDKSKDDLLTDINLLETYLVMNKHQFIENQKSYNTIINELKRRFFDQKALENKLSLSEQKRLAEKRKYQSQILAVLGVVLLFALLIILLFYLRSRLKRQQNALIEANKVVKNTNENLEFIVSERTHLLQQTFKELDLVLYRASHDLRAPICSIAGLSDLIARESGNQELTELVLKTNQQMDKLLKKLSTISEIHQPGDYQMVDVNVLLSDVVSRFKEQLRDNSIALNLEIEKDLSMKTIPMLVESILFHLLENAIFFSQINQKNKAQVKLVIQLDEKYLQIRIEDNGIGIEAELLPKLFDMFFKGTEYSKGNGLGLYIVKKSTDLLSGEIEIDCSRDQYTIISVAIPLDLSKSHVLDFLKEAK
ncbi:MAG: signal transduction histidine kinase [Marivirga sp.]|jgi:signal transduction histidine kinase